MVVMILLTCSALGSVPVYFGDSAHCARLLPHPSAAIFLADFDHNVTRLVDYLRHLIQNQTAYELHRDWRREFSNEYRGRNVYLQENMPCKYCKWVVANRVHEEEGTRRHKGGGVGNKRNRAIASSLQKKSNQSSHCSLH